MQHKSTALNWAAPSVSRRLNTRRYNTTTSNAPPPSFVLPSIPSLQSRTVQFQFLPTCLHNPTQLSLPMPPTSGSLLICTKASRLKLTPGFRPLGYGSRVVGLADPEEPATRPAGWRVIAGTDNSPFRHHSELKFESIQGEKLQGKAGSSIQLFLNRNRMPYDWFQGQDSEMMLCQVQGTLPGMPEMPNVKTRGGPVHLRVGFGPVPAGVGVLQGPGPG
ncbi:hypothetical protein B0H13DRAFT_1892830 [Mycena leptocephala]|nr:hypothetical protein B0H13DRAFT_1892830 [Mycena leptocephala]